MLFWTALPSLTMANFITPGKPITPGTSITPGDPIKGGKFIVPGEPYAPGDAIEGGKSIDGSISPITGQPIIPSITINIGQFIVPNNLGSTTYGQWLIAGQFLTPGADVTTGDSIVTGQGLTGGDASQGGQGLVGGDASQGGQGLVGGDASQGGQGLVGGDASQGGQGFVGGDASQGGQGLVGGDAGQGGQGLVGGDGGQGGQGLVGGDGGQGGQGLTGSNAVQGGQDLTGGNSTESGDGITNRFGELGGVGAGVGVGELSGTQMEQNKFSFFKFTNDESSVTERIAGGISDFKKYVLGFGKKVAEGSSSIYAGFKFNPKDSGKYGVSNKHNVKNSIVDKFYQKYKKFTLQGKDYFVKPGTAHVGQGYVDDFLKSKGIANTTGSFSKFIKSSVAGIKPALNDGYNVFSKDFWAKSNMAKMNGPVNIALSSFGSIYNYGIPGGKHTDIGLASTDFAADLTTEVAIGVGTTALSTVAASMAAGAMGGSVVPGLGTIVGATAGLATGLIVAYGLNTPVGRKVKGAVKDGVKFVYDGAVNGVKKGWNMATEGTKNLFNGAKGLFGW